MSPDFSKDFTLYTFTYDFVYAVVLTQKNELDHEIIISFMSSTFKGEKLNYSAVEKHDFIFFKEVKHFRF
jgi:hypothetical protein